MFGLNENTQYYVCQRYVRMNMSINGLYQIVRTEMELPPLGGAVFIFFSKNVTTQHPYRKLLVNKA